ncbi:hypothetical protein GTQ40_13785 [Flavobacteriaceae bacterium R38]|nr:hypothetical protein [Flavobacteriaceae bacterium R38]
MKKCVITLLFIIYGTCLLAQDVFQKELFSTNLVLKNRNEINLSNQQVDNIKKIYDNHISDFNSIKWDLNTEFVDLGKLLAVSKIDEKRSLAKMEKIITLENKLKLIRLEMLIKIKNELNASQQKKLKTLRTDEDIENLDLIIPIDISQRVILRGSKNDSKENAPLFILIDRKGERTVSRDIFKNLDQSKIESVSVLKKPSATKKYGEKGRNGVVIIRIK